MATTQKKDEEQPDAAKAAREAAKETEPAEEAESYDTDWLIEAAPSYGFLRHEVAGALSAISKKSLTIEEAKAATSAWLKAPVKEA